MKAKAQFLGAAMSIYACVMPAHASSEVQPEAYPTRPITLIVGFSPGGSNDLLARLLARELQESMGQTVVVENRPSTGAITGALALARAKPDGYTLMVGASGPIVINKAVYRQLPYSPQEDFTPISLMATFPLILSTQGGSQFKSIDDLVAYTSKNPELSNYSSSSSAFQLAAEMLKENTGIQAEHVPYKGSNNSMMAVASGEVTFSLLDPGPAAGALKGNLVRGIAVTSAERVPSYPDIPTLKEQGVDLEIEFWIGLFAPAGTPAPIIQRLEQETAKAVANVQVARNMGDMGLTPAASTSKEFESRIAREIDQWTALAKQKNIVVE
jgi:tripartite-type tricarboxylate transporter receptor subunit TctC